MATEKMKLLLKISLSIITLLVIAVISFVMLFNPNDYKNEITALVKEQTGRELTILGDISLSLFPWIGIELGEVEMSNAIGFTPRAFAKMKHVQVRAKLLPLLKKQLQADTIVIEDLSLHLAKNKKGITSWDDLTNKNTAEAPAAKITKAPSQSTPVTSHKNILAAIALNGLEIKNAQFHWNDQQQNQQLSLTNLNLSLGALRAETKVPLKTQFDFTDKSNHAAIQFSSKIKFSADFSQFEFHDTQLGSQIKLSSFRSSLSPILNSPLIKINLNKKTFSSEKLSFQEGNLKTLAKVSANNIIKEPYFIGHIAIEEFNPTLYAKRFGIKLPEMSDSKAVSQFNTVFDIKGSLKKINLSKIQLTLDDTTVSGQASHILSSAQSKANLTVDKINIDRYLPVETKNSDGQKDNVKQNNKSSNLIIIPIALLNSLNLDAKLNINQFSIKNTQWNKLQLNLLSKNGETQIKPLTVSGYNSIIKGSASIKTVKNNAYLNASVNIKDLYAGKLLNDFIKKDKLKGLTSLTASLKTSGLTLADLKKHLNGNLKLNLKDGTIKGFDLNHQKEVLNAKIKRTPVPATPQPEETKIANLNATAVIKNGVLKNTDLRAATPLSRIAGQGTVNLVNENINYVASAKFTSSTKIASTTPYEKINKTPLDIIISGTFEQPSVNVDFKNALKNSVKKSLNKQKNKIKEKVKDDIKKELEKKLGDKLKDLFKF